MEPDIQAYVSVMEEIKRPKWGSENYSCGRFGVALLEALGSQMKSVAVVLILLGIVLPAMGEEPTFARTCLKATQTERGRMTEITVAESSGFRSADAFARNLVKVFRLELKRSESVPRQEGFVVVDLFEDGSFASTLFKNKGRLVRACNDPTPLENGF